ncbi:MAG: heme exporter protein CcmB, partial [Pseudomonadota bacterium]
IAATRAVFRRELLLAGRNLGDTLAPAGFFAVGATLFPLGVGPSPDRLAAVAAGVAWVLALFATLSAAERAFQDEAEDGGLELLLSTAAPPSALFLAKAAALAVTAIGPLIPVAVVAALALGMPIGAAATLCIALALAAPSLASFAALGAALTIGARRRGVLIGLLTTPLLAPIVIFGASAAEAAATGMAAQAQLLLLGAIACAATPLCALAGGAAIREAVR